MKDMTLTVPMFAALETIACLGDIGSDARRWSGLGFSAGTVRALERRGYVVADEREDGTPIYALTPAGVAQLKAWGRADGGKGRV